MKKSLLLGLASFFLQTATSFGQPIFTPPPPTTVGPPPIGTPIGTPLPSPMPIIIEEGGMAAPRGPWLANSVVGRGQDRFWASGEYLLWWTKNAPVNTPVLTRVIDPTAANPGAVGSPGTAVALGGQDYNLGARHGGRFTLGGWFDCSGTIGMEGSYFFLSSQSTTSTVSTDGTPGSPTFALPFRDAFNGQEASIGLGGPIAGLTVPASGTLRLSNQLSGGDVNLIARLWRTECFSLTGMAGFRYLRFKEDLDFTAGNSFAPANAFGAFHDSFQASNNFYSGQIGLRAEYRTGNFFLEATAKIALGSMNQTVEIAGSAVGQNANFANTNNGGFYALSSNIGEHSRNVFAYAPEADVKFGYNLTRNISAFASYSFLYINNVQRPGNAIDRTINPAQAPGFGGTPGNLAGGPASPSFNFNRSDFWAQGIGFGLQVKY